MTKELAIQILRGEVLGTNEQTHEAVFMAIKALKAQDATGDMISRQAAIAAFKPYALYDSNRTNAEWVRRIELVLEELPSAEKHGKWIKDGESYALYKCSACNDLCTVAGWANCIPEEQMYKAFKYCPNCGAKMERSKDAEHTD